MGYLGLSVQCILIKIGDGIWMRYAVLESVRCFLELSPFFHLLETSVKDSENCGPFF